MHPLDDPDFDHDYKENVWYLAHPLADDDQFTFQQNMDHTIKMMRLCYKEGYRVIAPWHTICLALPETPENRRVGLECDCKVAHALGRIILTGHKISRGMLCERDAVIRRLAEYKCDYGNLGRYINQEDIIIDLTNMSHENARNKLREKRGN